MPFRFSSTLLVPRAANHTSDVAGHIADGGQLSLAQEARPLRRVTFKAGRKGDSVAAVAQRYRVSPDQVAAWNKLGPKGQFKPGQSVMVMLPEALTLLMVSGPCA